MRFSGYRKCGRQLTGSRSVAVVREMRSGQANCLGFIQMYHRQLEKADLGHHCLLSVRQQRLPVRQ